MITNKEFARTDELFKTANDIAFKDTIRKVHEKFMKGGLKEDYKPTSRQASKFRNKKGLSYRYKGTAASMLARQNKKNGQKEETKNE